MKKERRYMVTFETNGQGTTTRRVFSMRADAMRFAQHITTAGMAWPAEAFIQAQRRESQFDEWEDYGAEFCIWDQRTRGR